MGYYRYWIPENKSRVAGDSKKQCTAGFFFSLKNTLLRNNFLFVYQEHLLSSDFSI